IAKALILIGDQNFQVRRIDVLSLGRQPPFLVGREEAPEDVAGGGRDELGARSGTRQIGWRRRPDREREAKAKHQHGADRLAEQPSEAGGGVHRPGTSNALISIADWSARKVRAGGVVDSIESAGRVKRPAMLSCTMYPCRNARLVGVGGGGGCWSGGSS